MKNRIVMAALIFGALAGCDRLSGAASETEPAPTTSDPVTATASTEGEADSEWIELIGVWAPEGQCGDAAKEWRLEPQAFHLNETHCRIDRLELIKGGVRAVAQCSVEGDDDHIPDVFKFVRRPDFTLSVINEANDAATDGLVACAEDMIP